MNPNPYPQGRWTQFVASSASRKSRNRLTPEPVSSLAEAPLKELFWGLPESRLFEDARLRLENAVANAMVAPGLARTGEVQPELAVAG